MVVRRVQVLALLICLLVLGSPAILVAQTLPSTTLTSDERAFLREVETQVERAGEIADDASLALESSVYSSRFSRLWAGVVQDFQDLHEDTLTLTPSPRQAHLAVLWIEATAILADSTALFQQGVDTSNSRLTDDSTEMLDEANTIITTLTSDRDDFDDDPNVILKKAIRVDAPVEDCDVFTSFEVAQVYYALHPEEQSILDPNRDGRACEKEFDRVATISRRVPKFPSVPTPTPKTAKPTDAPGRTPTTVPTTPTPEQTTPPTAKPGETQTAARTPTTIATEDHFRFEGTGSQVETFTITKKGLYLMTIETSGTYAGVTIFTMDGEPVASTLSGKAGETNEAAVPLDSGNYYVQISGTSEWTVTLDPMT